MKKVLLYTPVVLSLLLLGAHFLRSGNSVGVVGSLAMIALLFVTRPWVARLAQLVLVFGALTWLRTLYVLVQMRGALDQPYVRLIVILGLVAAVTLASALIFQTKAFKRAYRLDRGE